ncbi:hypothetical protein [Woodsholea maritima]|uniref:hypothetical protein n=1 Tax=Woodsholea maritima TaxID=240237 RepID=UPI0003A4915F|nr:hypothetical protein [Woodsholea maritima]
MLIEGASLPSVIGSTIGELIARGACFVAGTPVMTPSGPKPIEESVAGDQVYARSDQVLADPVVRARPVLETYRFEQRQTLALSVAGQGLRDMPHTTHEHPPPSLNRYGQNPTGRHPRLTRQRHRAGRG